MGSTGSFTNKCCIFIKAAVSKERTGTQISRFSSQEKKHEGNFQVYAIAFIQLLQISFGNIFQEYNKKQVKTSNVPAKNLHFVWVLATTFLSMAFVGNLKSALVRNGFEPRTQSLSEMVDKDTLIIMPEALENYLEMDDSDSLINKRILCQARKTNGVLKIE